MAKSQNIVGPQIRRLRDAKGWSQEVFAALGIRPNIVHVSTDLIAAYWAHAEASLTGDKINSVVFDNAKIRRLVPDFHCEVRWAEGVRRAIGWHRAHPEFQTVDAEMERIMDDILAGQESAMRR